MRRRSDALQLVVGGERGPGRASAGTRNVRGLPGEAREISRARELLQGAGMSAHDFSLDITVDIPADPRPPVRRVHVDEHAPTRPFTRVAALPNIDRRPLPGVDLRPAQQRPAEAAHLPVAVEPAPLAAPRHAWMPAHSGHAPTPSRQKARSLLGVPPPPPTRAAPLSDEDGARAARRVRAYKRQAWAQDMLEKLFRDSPE
jgi:hypothetical protein